MMESIEEENNNDVSIYRKAVPYMPIIIGCGILLIIGLYLLGNIQKYTNDCNSHWIAQMDRCQCACLNGVDEMQSPEWSPEYMFTPPALEYPLGSD